MAALSPSPNKQPYSLLPRPRGSLLIVCLYTLLWLNYSQAVQLSARDNDLADEDVGVFSDLIATQDDTAMSKR